MAKIEEKVEKLIKSKIENIGYEIYDIEYVKEGTNYYLRIYIDKEERGINIEDCEKVSNEINETLEQADYIKEQYYLEVSSPGIERIIRKNEHLEKNIGKTIQIKLFKKNEKGIKAYKGELKKYDTETITIIEEETKEEKKIERKNIAQIKTVYNWEE